MDYKRVKSDINGNPRYVFHFLSFISEDDDEILTDMGGVSVENMYKLALSKAKQIGGKAYRGKDFGGGIVLQSHNIYETIEQIKAIANEKSI